MADRESVFSRPSLFRTLSLAAVTVVSLVLIDGVLANTEQRETALEAARLNRDGRQLMQEGRFADAAEAFRAAIANARGNREYPLALGESLADAGRLDDAAEVLTDLLKTDSMAGATNLAMARVFSKEGDFAESAFYYHRAIYGQWPADASGNRQQARFELADLLARRGSKPELLAELLPLQEEAPSDPATQTRLAQLYLTAGSPARAGAIFRDLAHAQPQNPDLREALGDAEFAGGNYAASQSDYLAASRLSPANQQIAKKLDLCDRVLELDPMRRGIAGQERYQRSVRVLDLATAKASGCPAAMSSESTRGLISEAGARLKQRVSVQGQSEAVETNVDLAARIWQAEKASCASAIAAENEPLQLVLAKNTP